MSDQRKERCATCRWWSRIDQSEMIAYLERLAQFEEQWSYTHKSLAREKEVAAIGEGSCCLMPTPVPGKRGTDFCGQWAPVDGEEPRTLKDGEIAARLDVLDRFRISPEDIREVTASMDERE